MTPYANNLTLAEYTAILKDHLKTSKLSESDAFRMLLQERNRLHERIEMLNHVRVLLACRNCGASSRQLDIRDMRRRGFTFKQIGASFGISGPAAKKYLGKPIAKVSKTNRKTGVA